MALMIVPIATYYASATDSGASHEGHSHMNFATLNKLSTDTNGHLSFNGHIIGEAAIETSCNFILDAHITSLGYIELPHDCDLTRAISVSLNGISLPRYYSWEVIEKTYPEADLIAWDGLELQSLAQIGDILLVSYYKKI